MKSVGEVLEHSAEKFGENPFIYLNDDVLNFKELNYRSNQIANWLTNQGFNKGHKAIILMDTSFEWVYTWFGLVKAGVIAIPINTAYKGKMLQYLIHDSGAELIFIDEKYTDRMSEIKEELKDSQIVLNSDYNSEVNLGSKTYNFSELFETTSTQFKTNINPSDTVAMLYTSGTTGPSKGVVQPNNQYVWCGKQMIKQINLKSSDTFYSWFPLFHIVPVGMIFMSSLLAGSSIALTKKFSVSKFWDEVRYYNATLTGGFTTMIELLYKSPPQSHDKKNSLRQIIVGGIPKDIANDFEKRFNLALTEDYGMTEAEPISYLTKEDRLKKPGSCGRPVDDFEVKIFDDNDNDLEATEVGEIVIRPKKPYIMMKGYYNKPKETVDSWRNLWFHTGDFGYLDKDGYLYFVDRKKDAIRRRGENISSYELEAIVNAHPKVLESAAIGIPSELGEEDVKVVVQLKDGLSITPDELIAYCVAEMAFFMVPRYIEFVHFFPRTETEKILKRDLRNINKNTWDREIQSFVE